MTSIPNKAGLILLAAYWAAMAGLTINAMVFDEARSNPPSYQRAGRLVPSL